MNKSSNIKTKFSAEEVTEFAISSLGAKGNVTTLNEGHMSQVFSFSCKGGDKRVIRLGQGQDSFLKDRYAYDNFAEILPIPKIFDIASFFENTFYCVSEFVEGVPSDQLSKEEMLISLNDQSKCFTDLFMTDIKDTCGWHDIDINSGNGIATKWKEGFVDEIRGLDEIELRKRLRALGVDDSTFQAFTDVFFENMRSLNDPVRRLVHGDLGFDNVLIREGRVVAILDWADVGYGDWVFEYARFNFWWPGRYTDILVFGENNGLDCENLVERNRAATAFIALTTLNWAIQKESVSTLDWIKSNLEDRLISL